MKSTYLEFEKSIESLESKITSLRKANTEHPSLDIKTEQDIMTSIDRLKGQLTIIIVTHRLITL